MPLLEVTQTRHISASIRLTDTTALQVDQYAAFIHASADDVVEQALAYVFSKDRDFQEFLRTPEAQRITPTLRMRVSKTALSCLTCTESTSNSPACGTAISMHKASMKPSRTSRFAASRLPAERTHARRVTAPRAFTFNRSKGVFIMEQTVINATEYRELPLALLNESKTNPRRVFDDISLRELAASIRSQGVLSPLLVRPLTENGFEIVAGARRYRAAQMA